MTLDEYEASFRCGYCNRAFPVPSLARSHEAKHEAANTTE